MSSYSFSVVLAFAIGANSLDRIRGGIQPREFVASLTRTVPRLATFHPPNALARFWFSANGPANPDGWPPEGAHGASGTRAKQFEFASPVPLVRAEAGPSSSAQFAASGVPLSRE